jgi:signal transduction histidine kinase
LIDAHGLKFEAHLDDHAIVMADPIRLQQAIGNVLGNACRYTPPGGRITVAVAVGSMVTVTVRDTGVGIAAADLSRVFEPFERGPHSTGLGLGLFLARSIVQSTGGSLDVISAGEGAGSTFIIRLPLLRHSTQEEPAAQSTRSA